MMKLHELRVIKEKQELDDKLAKLKEYRLGPPSPIFKPISPVDQDLLNDQYAAMEQYSTILGKRIDRFVTNVE